ncbi:hypothetical protein HPB47_021520, partial [Ixodes persulcatus]
PLVRVRWQWSQSVSHAPATDCSQQRCERGPLENDGTPAFFGRREEMNDAAAQQRFLCSWRADEELAIITSPLGAPPRDPLRRHRSGRQESRALECRPGVEDGRGGHAFGRCTLGTDACSLRCRRRT